MKKRSFCKHFVLLAGALPARLAPLAALGRWPLTVYLLHQPLLIGALTLAATLRA